MLQWCIFEPQSSRSRNVSDRGVVLPTSCSSVIIHEKSQSSLTHLRHISIIPRLHQHPFQTASLSRNLSSKPQRSTKYIEEPLSEYRSIFLVISRAWWDKSASKRFLKAKLFPLLSPQSATLKALGSFFSPPPSFFSFVYYTESVKAGLSFHKRSVVRREATMQNIMPGVHLVIVTDTWTDAKSDTFIVKCSKRHFVFYCYCSQRLKSNQWIILASVSSLKKDKKKNVFTFHCWTTMVSIIASSLLDQKTKPKVRIWGSKEKFGKEENKFGISLLVVFVENTLAEVGGPIDEPCFPTGQCLFGPLWNVQCEREPNPTSPQNYPESPT